MNAIDQRTRLLSALQTQPVTTLQARQNLDVLHPAARVQELREAGHRIETHWCTEETRPCRFHRVARYVLLSEA